MNIYLTTPMVSAQIPLAEIKENDWDLSINRYKEIVYEEVEYDSPVKILSKIQLLDKQRKVLIDKLIIF